MKIKWKENIFGNYEANINNIRLEISAPPMISFYHVFVYNKNKSKAYLACTSLESAKRKARQIYNVWFKK